MRLSPHNSWDGLFKVDNYVHLQILMIHIFFSFGVTIKAVKKALMHKNFITIRKDMSVILSN